MAKKSGKKAAAKKATPKGPRQQKIVGDHTRLLASKSAVKNYIDEVLAAKNETSSVGQEISSATKTAKNAGVNVPAARIAARILSVAKSNSLKGRVLWEDVKYCLEECTEFDKIAPPGMFPADEVRSTKNGKKKAKPAQTDIEDVEDVTGKETEVPPVAADETRDESAPVH